MGISTDGQICYGVLVEDKELPWGEEYDWDIEDWWLDMQGYKPPFRLYDEKGEYLDGKEPPRSKIEQYYREQREFIKSHPIPIEEVNYCSAEFPMYILAIPRTCIFAGRGFPEAFNPADLVVSDEEKQKLVDFCNTYGIEFEGEPQWWLSSFWG